MKNPNLAASGHTAPGQGAGSLTGGSNGFLGAVDDNGQSTERLTKEQLRELYPHLFPDTVTTPVNNAGVKKPDGKPLTRQPLDKNGWAAVLAGLSANPIGKRPEKHTGKVVRPTGRPNTITPVKTGNPRGPTIATPITTRPIRKATNLTITADPAGPNKQKTNNNRTSSSRNTVRDENKQTCKARPKSNRPKGGGGGGKRRFVPWC